MIKPHRAPKFLGTALGLLLGVPLLVFGMAVLWPHAEASPVRQANPLVITGVTIVDVQAGSLIPVQSVVFEGSRITAVGPASSAITMGNEGS